MPVNLYDEYGGDSLDPYQRREQRTQTPAPSNESWAGPGVKIPTTPDWPVPGGANQSNVGTTPPQKPPTTPDFPVPGGTGPGNIGWSNPSASQASGSSKYAPRLIQRNGQWVLTEHGNERVLQPNEVSGAQSYVTQFWAQTPTGFQSGVGPQTNEQYTAPQAPARTYAANTAMPGWAGDKWADLAHVTPKYTIGRILSKYPPTPAGLAAAKAEIEATGLATVADPASGNIQLTDASGFGGQQVDVGMAFKEGGGRGWWWGDQGAGSATSPGQPTFPSNPNLPPGTAQPTDIQNNAGRRPGEQTGSTGQGMDERGVRGQNLSQPGAAAGYTQFDDPASNLLSQLALDRVNRLSTAPAVPNMQAYAQALSEGKTENDARVEALARTIQEMAGKAYGGPDVGETAMTSRIADLQGEPYTRGDEAVMRARAFDEYEKRRQATLRNDMEGVASRGFAPSSGLVKEQQNETNRQFEQGRTTLESSLLLDAMKEKQTRARESTALSQNLGDRQRARQERAVELEQMAQGARASGDVVSLNYLAQIADIEAQMNAEADKREQDRLIAAGIPVDLQNRNVQLAFQILGQGGSPEQVVSALSGVAQTNNQAQSIANQASQQKWTGLGNLASAGLDAYSRYRQPTVTGAK